MKKDPFSDNEHDPKTEAKLAHARTLIKGTFDPAKYEYTDKFIAGAPGNAEQAHTMAELAECVIKNKDVGFEGIVIHANAKGQYTFKRMNKEAFVSAWKTNSKYKKLREATDYFGTSGNNDGPGSNAGLVGDDFVPLLGGPFNKQLYYYDALRMFALCFHAYHHDPVARAFIGIMSDFVLGRGFRVDAKHKDPKKQQVAQALWAAFEEANELQNVMAEHIVKESSRDGEIMLWKLPNNETKMGYQLAPGQEVPKGLLPRYRLIDPSTCWEIVTYPEDISRVLFYQLVYPTQYQTYTGTDGGSSVPSTKFIIQQVPASQVRHYKLNASSNEKRGRSDLFPILGYLKRMRDSVDYSLIAQQKNSAYSLDTEIQGSQSDVDAYVTAQESLGTIPPAGSEFVHTAKIKRLYLGNTGGGHSGSGDAAFEMALNMACIGYGVPVSYLGTHLAGAQARASALVGTEPVAKKFQKRQRFVARVFTDMAKDLMADFGIDGIEWEVTFPEIITQDRSAKIKDIITAEDARYISRARAAEMTAKELDITEYDYETEKAAIDAEQDPPITPVVMSPLTAPPAAPAAQAPAKPAADPSHGDPQDNPGASNASAVTSAARRKLSMNYGA